MIGLFPFMPLATNRIYGHRFMHVGTSQLGQGQTPRHSTVDLLAATVAMPLWVGRFRTLTSSENNRSSPILPDEPAKA